ncbi:hypothetical protein DSM104443_04279 [Usitatibacter rugosus]|uniref:Uncharacterized protein n=1 Tax=Usitatibacter rugosus TaxID=2732067 RepID=A0A6M4H3V0_9PROT|nr:hypothetical protein [Usitatibacter rugosus]QJR13184.1 hypothetical protein DSM104443_04279 [Usitatibacter rugosus]
MGILLFAVVGAAIGYFGGSAVGLYDGYTASAPFIGAAVAAVAAALIGVALKPRKTVYNRPTFD